ncbi:hypothetical protein SAMN05421788_110167 [Filimonas lacunae]|uniref:Uncharacterized protein n=1 Tax=Filimonas lacunae TaxID=477680 RepID=A0A1N7R8R4_9BACT|nr:hypothetical protein [Filimonas lacunae]SIT31429.1 hypothetical protein SAMN05421788_110167 [Filimonas lacunae]
MLNSVYIIIQYINGATLYYSIYILNHPFKHEEKYLFNDDFMLLVTDIKGYARYVSETLEPCVKYSYAPSGYIKRIDSEIESDFIL